MDEKVINSAKRACESCKEQFHVIEHNKDLLTETFGNIEYQVSEMRDRILNVDFEDGVNVTDIVNDLSITVGKIKDEMQNEVNIIFDKRKENLDWFTITFFGITNAGKSTLIETIVRDKGGNTIGEGKHNTTKEVSDAAENLNMPHVRILDTPGFEGGKQFEILAKEEIERTDLAIFVSSQKAPEIEEIRKVIEWIKNHNLPMIMVLNQRSQPVSVKNIRDFKPGIKACILTNSILKEELHLVNFNVLSVHAQIAFFSMCNDISSDRQDLIKQKNSITTLFKKHEIEMYEYSNFAMLMNEISRIIINEGELIKLKNLYDSLTIFIENSQRSLIIYEGSFDKTKNFLIEKISLLKKEFGSEQDLGQIGKVLHDILSNKMSIVDELKQNGLAIINLAFTNRDKNVKEKLEDLIKTFNIKLKQEVLPELNKEIKDLLITKLNNFEKEFKIEAKSFVNISNISMMIDSIIEDYCNNKIPHYMQLAVEIVLTIAEAIVFIFFNLFGFVVTGLKWLFSKIFGSSAEKKKAEEERYNKKRIEACLKFEENMNSMKEELITKMWNGYFDKLNMKRQNGLKSIILEIRENIIIPMNSLYYVCKDGSEILNNTYTTLEMIKDDLNLELFEFILNKMYPEKHIELHKVIRKPGVYSYVFCDQDDYEAIVAKKDEIGILTRDSEVNAYIWEESEEKMIHKIFNSFSNDQFTFEGVSEKRTETPSLIIRYKKKSEKQMSKSFKPSFKPFVENLYNRKVEMEEVV